ncbi:MAG: DUF4398 domain-containing protein [Polyangiaceae bacterium]
MRLTAIWASAPALLLVACASFPVPTQRMADAESAHRSAIELGASAQPAAELHVKLAEEQLAQAKVKITDGDNKTADSLLIRSKADSELALALAKEQGANVDTQRAVNQSKSTDAMNSAEGAVK